MTNNAVESETPGLRETGDSTDVLIVGAGPTGLMLTNQLVRWGVRCLLIDKNPGPSIRSKALGVQARTLEIYSHLGIAEQAVKRGAVAGGAAIWTEGKPAARVPLGKIGHELSPYPFLLILGQDENERLLGEALGQSGIGVQWGTELVALVQDGERVAATVKQPDGSTRRIGAQWIAGCDGAHSAVRSLKGIPFLGAPYEHVFFVADATVTGSMFPGELNVYLWRDGFHLFFPMNGTHYWRVVGILPKALRHREDLNFDEVIPSIRDQVGSLAFQDCHWFSTYRIHHRRAKRFRDLNGFLLGDAAHVHSPVGAQGMNTGLQDAYNLGWKLALVVLGRSKKTLLESYAFERERVAERLLKTTDKAFSIIVSDRWFAGLFRIRVLAKVLAFAMRLERIRTFAFRTISQTGIRYRSSPLSQTPNVWPPKSPRGGDRFPWLRLKFLPDGPVEDLYQKLDDTRFNLLIIGESSPSTPLPDKGDLILIHRIPNDPVNEMEFNRLQIPNPSFFLIRPDGYIGLAGTNFDSASMARYLAERIGLKDFR